MARKKRFDLAKYASGRLSPSARSKFYEALETLGRRLFDPQEQAERGERIRRHAGELNSDGNRKSYEQVMAEAGVESLEEATARADAECKALVDQFADLE